MKWLLLSLLSINLILFLVHYKENGGAPLSFEKSGAASSIQLLSEVSAQSVGARDGRCFVLAGLDDTELARIKEYLVAQDIRFERVDKQEELAPSYWVYVKRDEGKELSKESLKLQGIDSFEILEGELKGMLSVGLFENIDLARALVKKLESKGIAADFFERKKIKRTASLEIKTNQIKDKDAFLKGLQESKINVGEIKEFFCKSVASEK